MFNKNRFLSSQPKTLFLLMSLFTSLFSALPSFSQTKPVMLNVPERHDLQGRPLKALDWLAQRPLPLQMPAPKGCTEAQLAQNRLDWYGLPFRYDTVPELDQLVRDILGTKTTVSSEGYASTWAFKRFDITKPVKVSIFNWESEPTSKEIELAGVPLSANYRAGIITMLKVFSDITGLEIELVDERSELLADKPLLMDIKGADDSRYIRINLIDNLHKAKKLENVIITFAIATMKSGRLEPQFVEIYKEGGTFDRILAAIEKYDSDLAWGVTSTVRSLDEKQDYYDRVFLKSTDIALTTEGMRALTYQTGLFQMLAESLVQIAGRVRAHPSVDKYTNFFELTDQDFDGNFLKPENQTSYLTPSRVPLPGVSAIAYKPLDLMLYEAMYDDRVPTTNSAREAYPVIVSILKERWDDYRDQLRQILAEDTRIAKEAGLRTGDGCRYSKAEMMDDSIAVKIAAAEAKGLGLKNP